MKIFILTVLSCGALLLALSVNGGKKHKATSILPTHCHYQDHGVLPDSQCTPGLYNPAVTQKSIKKTICVVGWTATIRPPVSVTEPIKFKVMKQYGVTDSASNYELDHLIPLELGGSPDSVKNLWPEPHGGPFGSYKKDGWENKLKYAVCNGTMKLAAARKIMRSGSWVNG